MKRIIIASNNQGKIKEIKNIFGDRKLEFLSMNEVGFNQEIIEDQDSFEGNALKKASTVMDVLGEITLADDSGLEVDALNGRPGVFSARFSGEGSSDMENNKKLLRLLKGLPCEARGAQFRCVIVLLLANGQWFMTEGICHGRISDRLCGNKGFGYDPLFIPEGFKKSFAELPRDTKNKISHRFIALNKLKEIMEQEGLLDSDGLSLY